MGNDDRDILFINRRNVLFLGVLPILVDAVKRLAQAVLFLMDRFDLDVILDTGEEVLFLLKLLELLLDALISAGKV